MLKIEKTLKELRDLQNTLRELGIEMSIKDADDETKNDYEDAAMTINIYEPCRCFAWVGMDGVIHMRWNSYPNASAWFRMNLLLDLACGYMLKADSITKSWTHLRRNLDGQADEMPLPAKLAGRKAEYENAANRLRDRPYQSRPDCNGFIPFRMWTPYKVPLRPAEGTSSGV